MRDTDGAHTASPFAGTAAEGTDGTPDRRRALPSPAEQKRRKEWGEKWGKLVSEAVRNALKGSE